MDCMIQGCRCFSESAWFLWELFIYRKMQLYFTKSIHVLQLVLGSNFTQTTALKFQHSRNIFLLFVWILDTELIKWVHYCWQNWLREDGSCTHPCALECLWLAMSWDWSPKDLIQILWIRQGLKIIYPTLRKFGKP